MSDITLLPPKEDLETKAVLKKLVEAHRYLAELKGVASAIPNQNILIDTLSLQEARESSAIENIISTFDEVYRSDWSEKRFITPAAKEVHSYAKALKHGFELVKKNGLLTNNHILSIQAIVEGNKAGFRKLPGTKLLNDLTGEIIYTPPQNHDTILRLMKNLEQYINNDEMSDADPLLKMAIIHFQFESIHPFYDGNGRTGRIINILYLIKNGLLDLPILYLSRYIIRHKADYYRLLQETRKSGDHQEWLIYMLQAVIEISKQSIEMVKAIGNAMQEYKQVMREKCPRIYSQDLLNNLFRHPYTKVEYIMHDLQVSRNTAIRYIEQLVKVKLVMKQKHGRDNFFLNKALVNVLVKPK